uniref:Uncharacterized protein n=1 Tax=Arundo donax TaxID=35708 RepID=A0A0A9HMD3_ARUDO
MSVCLPQHFTHTHKCIRVKLAQCHYCFTVFDPQLNC